MCPLRRVEGRQAGPAALGILVPPGRRTFLIVRPRSLSCDLVLLRPGPAGAFRDLGRVEAGAAARELYRVLGEPSAAGGVEAVACPDGQGFWLCAAFGPFALLACPRHPGQPYRPLVFADAEAARAAARQLALVLRPPAGVEQEVYLNTDSFAR